MKIGDIVTCINRKSFALTENQSYEIIDVKDNFIYIYNNANILVRYDKSLFECKKEEILESERFSIKLVNFDTSCFHDRVCLKISYSIFYDKKVWSSDSISCYYILVAGNCGVASFNGINSIASVIYTAIPSTNSESKIITNKLITSFIKQLFDYFKDHKSVLVFSSNNNFPELWKILDDLCEVKTRDNLVNHNESSIIRIWIKYLYSEEEDSEILMDEDRYLEDDEDYW